MEATWVSINSWMDKDMVDIYNRILLSNKRKWKFSICSRMDGLGGHYAKWNKSDRERQVLSDITDVWNFKNTTILVNTT